MTIEEAFKLARTMCTPEAIAFTVARTEYMRANDRFRRARGEETAVALEVKLAATNKLIQKRKAFIASVGETK